MIRQRAGKRILLQQRIHCLFIQKRALSLLKNELCTGIIGVTAKVVATVRAVIAEALTCVASEAPCTIPTTLLQAPEEESTGAGRLQGVAGFQLPEAHIGRRGREGRRRKRRGKQGRGGGGGGGGEGQGEDEEEAGKGTEVTAGGGGGGGIPEPDTCCAT